MAARTLSLISSAGAKGLVLVACGALAGCCALIAVSVVAAPTGLLIGLAASRSPEALSARMFDSRTAFAGARLLAGVSGEAVAADDARLPDTAEAPANALTEREVSPAALDRLNAGDCISLTTASGQKLSFRILGVQPAENGRKPDSAAVELAVTPCAPGHEIVLKAVIESKAEAKESVIQRNL